jgi:hypothetical protein
VPTLADNAASSSGTPSTSASVSLTPASGDVLVVKAVSEDSIVPLNTPTDTAGNSWTLRVSSLVSSHTTGYIWTAVAAGSSTTTITVAKTNGAGTFILSMCAEAWRSADLAPSPVTVAATGSGAPSTTLATSQAGSVVTWADGDWTANSPGSRTYDTTSASPVEEFIDDRSSTSTYVSYFAYQGAASAAAQTLGMTIPSSQTFTLVALEVLDLGGGGSGPDPNQYDRQPWH